MVWHSSFPYIEKRRKKEVKKIKSIWMSHQTEEGGYNPALPGACLLSPSFSRWNETDLLSLLESQPLAWMPLHSDSLIHQNWDCSLVCAFMTCSHVRWKMPHTKNPTIYSSLLTWQLFLVHCKYIKFETTPYSFLSHLITPFHTWGNEREWGLYVLVFGL